MVDGRQLARDKTFALTARIDAMLESWEHYAKERAVVCGHCRDGNHDNCRYYMNDLRCDCPCEFEEEVIVHGR